MAQFSAIICTSQNFHMDWRYTTRLLRFLNTKLVSTAVRRNVGPCQSGLHLVWTLPLGLYVNLRGAKRKKWKKNSLPNGGEFHGAESHATRKESPTPGDSIRDLFIPKRWAGHDSPALKDHP